MISASAAATSRRAAAHLSLGVARTRQAAAAPPFVRFGSSSSSSSSSSSASQPSPATRSASSNSKSPKPLSKVLKPSSKANARTSRLLREQLGSTRIDSLTEEQRASAIQAAQSSSSLEQEGEEYDTTSAPVTHPPKLKQVIAHATASAYDLNALIASGRLPPDWQLLEDGQVIYLPSWPVSSSPGPQSFTSQRPGSGEVFILRSGAYVTWGIKAEQSQRFRSLVLSPRHDMGQSRSGRPSSVERGPYEELGEEEMDYVFDPRQSTRVIGDVLVVGHAPAQSSSTEDASAAPATDDPWSPMLARLSYSAGLALSARLSSQEASLSSYLHSVQAIPQLLEQKGRVPISRRDVVRKMGRLLKLRQMVNLEEGSKVEELDLFWENATMEEHYDSVCSTLDIESRFRALNEQLDHAENLMGVLRALLTEGSSHRMEVIIIALIAIEVTLALISHGYLSNPFGDGAILPDHGSHTTPAPSHALPEEDTRQLPSLRPSDAKITVRTTASPTVNPSSSSSSSSWWSSIPSVFGFSS